MNDPAYAPADARGIWVFLEHDGKALAPVSLELAGKARELAGQSGAEVTGLLLGDGLEALAQECALLDVDHVVCLSDPLLELFTAEASARAVARLFLEKKPDIFLLGATAYGRDLAGRLAVMLRTGLTADCTDLALEEGTGLLLGEVSGFGGGILATIRCEKHRPQMATVRPGVFAETGGRRATPAPVEHVRAALTAADRPVRVLEQTRSEGVDVSRAERLIVAGAGVRGDLSLVRALADALDAEVGVTRPVVDSGWAERERQIGQTGVIARPRLAVVCGASGASQFTVGIEQADFVIAVNQDPEASIFEQADLCVVDDLVPVLRGLIAELEATAGGAS